MPNIHDRTRRILNRREQHDNRAQRSLRHERAARLEKIKVKEQAEIGFKYR